MVMKENVSAGVMKENESIKKIISINMASKQSKSKRVNMK